MIFSPASILSKEQPTFSKGSLVASSGMKECEQNSVSKEMFCPCTFHEKSKIMTAMSLEQMRSRMKFGEHCPIWRSYSKSRHDVFNGMLVGVVVETSRGGAEGEDEVPQQPLHIHEQRDQGSFENGTEAKTRGKRERQSAAMSNHTSP